MVSAVDRTASYVQQMDLRGMGYVTGTLVHPTEPDLIYARTDSAGLLRWDPNGKRWIPLMDDESVEAGAGMNIDAAAIDPQNPERVFAAFGAYVEDGQGRDGLVRSDDRGATWTAMNFPSNIAMGGNSDWRWCGERIRVDPLNSNYVYFGTRQNGLWRSTDGGMNWAEISGLPYGDNGGKTRNGLPVNAGITFVAISPVGSTGAPVRASTVFVGIMNGGIWRSVDGGDSFSKISALTGGPDVAANLSTKPVQGVVAGDGTLYATFADSGVFRFRSGAWADVTPPTNKAWYSRNWVGVAVDPTNSDRIVVTAQGETPKDILLSTNAGATWTNYGPDPAYSKIWTYERPSWWPSDYINGLAGGVFFNPARPNELWWSGGYGMHVCPDLTASAPVVKISEYMQGMEELIATQTLGIPGSGPRFLVTAQDMGGFVFTDDHTVPSQRLSTMAIANGTGMAVCYNSPANLAIVGEDHGFANGFARRSADGGSTWSEFTSGTARGGNIAIDSGDPQKLVWMPRNAAPVFSTNGGASWAPATGTLPSSSNPLSSPWFTSNLLAADTVNPGTMYAYQERQVSPWTSRIHRSTDGGATWAVVNESGVVPNYWQVKLVAAPEIAGEVWVGVRETSRPLCYSTDGGVTFTEVTTIDDCRTFSLGPPLTAGSAPVLWMYGTVNSVDGLFVSLNRGATWDRILDGGLLPQQSLLCLGADLQYPGGLNIGFGGRGYFYLYVPLGEEIPPAPPAQLAARPLSATAVELTWLDQAADETAFELQRSSDGVNWSVVARPSADAVLATDAGLASGTLVFYRIRAMKGYVPSAFSEVAAATTWTLLTEALVPTGSSWKFLDNGSNQGTAWREAGFNDSTWPAGAAPLGYATSTPGFYQGIPLATTVSYGSNSAAKYITTYFRKTFNVADTTGISDLSLNLLRDDGAVVYLNGSEVARLNMPAGTINSTTYASSSSDYGYQTIPLSPSLLQVGVNTLAIEIHQGSAGSSDIVMDAELATVRTLTAYQAWLDAHGLPAGAGSNEDPDGDGFPNLLEYALGGVPTQASSPPMRPQSAMLGDELSLTIERPKSATGVIYQIEGSPSLEPGSWSASGVTTEVISEDVTHQLIRGRMTVEGDRGFMRLKVIMAP